MSNRAAQLLRGTLDILVLKALAAGPLHGYAVSARVREQTDGAVDIDDGALYQSLHRLEERAYVEATWGHADNGKRARFYRLTPAGRRQLREETQSWIRYARTVMAVLELEAL